MKNFKFTGDQLTPTLRDKIADGDEGIYVVYGAFIEGTALNLTRLFKGSFNDIVLKIDDPTNVDPDKVEYLLPVPEYIVDHTDADYAKYLNIHLVPASDIEDDETMLRKFCEAYTKKLSEAGVTNSPDGGTIAEDAPSNPTDLASSDSLAHMEANLEKLQNSASLLATLHNKIGLPQVGQNSSEFLDQHLEVSASTDEKLDSDITDVVAKETK